MRTVGLLSLAAATSVGPIQKVLTLLNDLKSKVNAEGEVEADQFAKYAKWCETDSTERRHSIETGTNKVADLNASIEELTAEIGSLSSEIDQLNSALTQNEGDLKKATEIRDAEHAEFKQADKDLVDTVDTLVRASSILRRGSSSQLQTALSQVAVTLSAVMDAAVVSTHDRRRLAALLEASSEDGPSGAPTAAAYESHSNGIIDLLAELKVKAEQELSDLRKDEMERKHNFEMLAQSLTDQINTQARDQKNAVSSKTNKEEALGVAQGDLAGTNKNLASDKKYVGELNQVCSTRPEVCRMRPPSGCTIGAQAAYWAS